MTRVSAISSSRLADRRQSAGGVTLLVLVMLALAASPSMGKAALAASGVERTTETRAQVGGEQAIRVQRQVRRDRAVQRIHPAAVVVLDRTGRAALAGDGAGGLSFCLQCGPGLTGLVREALLALPPPVG